MKAVVYYRTRPSEPEASEMALQLQQQAVQRYIGTDHYTLVAEFIEREGESGERWPAYVAAVQAAVAQTNSEGGPSVTLIIASHAGIGSGEPFKEPSVSRDQAADGAMIMNVLLSAALVPTQPEIALPPDAPGSLCLYADFRPRQLDTLVYLCNAGLSELTEVTAAIDTISMHQFYRSEPAEKWIAVDYTQEKRWDRIASGTCVLVNTLSHVIWDEVDRYRLTYIDTAGQHWTARADDRSLNACRLSDDPSQVWVRFDAAHTTQADPGLGFDEVP